MGAAVLQAAGAGRSVRLRSRALRRLRVLFTDESEGDIDTWSWNLFGADSDTPASHTSSIYGLPLTDTTEVRVDLAVLFPGLDATTVLGLDWLGPVDTTGHAGAGLTTVVAYDTPITGLPTPYGELLLAVELLGGVNLFSSVAPSVGGVGTHTVSIPLDLSLEGLMFPTQALILGGGVELCNALDLTLGF